jgi:hypothetical protein
VACGSAEWPIAAVLRVCLIPDALFFKFSCALQTDRLHFDEQVLVRAADRQTDCISMNRFSCAPQELLLWFKAEFFRWVDVPSCDACGGQRVDRCGYGAATPDEFKSRAARVELFRCASCGSSVRSITEPIGRSCPY